MSIWSDQYRYVFLFVALNAYEDDLRAEMTRQADAFGLDLGRKGLFVQPFPERLYDVAREVEDKPWPDDVDTRLQHEWEPLIVVIDRAFETFDPREHPYAIIWLSDFQEDPAAIRPMLARLARLTRTGEDVIAYLQEVAERQRNRAAAEQGQRAVGVLARIASYVEIKPQVFGVSIDLKAVLRDIAEARTGSD
jgi:hypothetical protein